MFDSPGLITATAATEKGTPQAAPRSTFVPPKRKTRMSPRCRAASAGQFEARTTSFAFFDFAARRTSRRPKRTSPVSVATRRARGTSITGRPPARAPPGPAPGPEAVVDLLNRVRAGPRGVDVREFENLREVRSLRVDDVPIAALPDDRA